MSECAKHAGAAFAPHIETSLKALWETCGYFHPEVRGASTRALAPLVTAAAKAEKMAPWTKGQLASIETSCGDDEPTGAPDIAESEDGAGVLSGDLGVI